jgi:two-component system copper resistance phosphate regulon response regulator CusR
MPVAAILIAEDEIRIASFLAKGLQKAGYQTQIATDGEQALALALTGQFSLILLDLGLPRLDGWTVLSQIRSQSFDPPVIIVTALDGLNERQKSLSLGANDYITKPFRFSTLLARIQCYL